jgi:hypothetical protein
MSGAAAAAKDVFDQPGTAFSEIDVRAVPQSNPVKPVLFRT